jgi:spermidine synthase
LSYPSQWCGQVHVEQKGSVRYLYVGRKDVIQTRMDMRRPARLLSPYLQCMLVALGFFAEPREELRRVAMIGLGGGAWTRFFHARRPKLVFHSVDIDPVVVAVARQFFGVRDTATYRSYAMDGRRFLREAKRPYDLIVLDAFDAAANVPKQLVSVEFFRLIRKRLTPHGVLAINFLVHSRRVYSALVRTVRAVFPAVARFPLRSLSTHNALLVAPKDGKTRPRVEVLKARVRRLAKTLSLSFSLERCAQTLDTDRLVAPTGPLLRDPSSSR